MLKRTGSRVWVKEGDDDVAGLARESYRRLMNEFASELPLTSEV